jgi:hypothetical protein
LAAWVIWGAAQPHFTRSVADVRAAYFLLGFPMAVALFTWCKLDAAERGVVAPPAAALLVGAFAPIGVPYYFLRTMSLRSATYAIGKALLFYLALGVAIVVGKYLGTGRVV